MNNVKLVVGKEYILEIDTTVTKCVLVELMDEKAVIQYGEGQAIKFLQATPDELVNGKVKNYGMSYGIVGEWSVFDNMKPFNLEEALNGKEVRLRNGTTAKIVSYMNKGTRLEKLLGVHKPLVGFEESESWFTDGQLYGINRSNLDIVGMA